MLKTSVLKNTCLPAEFFWECLMACNSKWSEHEGSISKISSSFSFSSPIKKIPLMKIFFRSLFSKIRLCGLLIIWKSAKETSKKFPPRAITKKKIISIWGISWLCELIKKVHLLLYSITFTLALFFCPSLKNWFWHFTSRKCCLVH